MKLSDNTIAILKNFSEISDGIIFVAGTDQKVLSRDNTILAGASFAETFPKNAPIVDLAKFIQNIEATDNHNISFETNWVAISDDAGTQNINYAYGAEGLITKAPDKNLDMTGATTSLSLSKEQIATVLKFANINRLPTLSFGSDGSSNYAEVYDAENPDSARFKLKTSPDSDGKVWSQTFKTERLSKIMTTSYVVKFVPDAYAAFESEIGATYIIAAGK